MLTFINFRVPLRVYKQHRRQCERDVIKVFKMVFFPLYKTFHIHYVKMHRM